MLKSTDRCDNTLIMRYGTKILTLAAILFTLSYRVYGQTEDAHIGFSPYSLFGVGLLSDQGSANALSMGGISTGVRDVRYINFLNPAAVTARQQQSFMMDFSLNADNNFYSSNAADGVGHKSVNNVMNMRHIVMSFPIYHHSAFKFGIQQYSSTGYKFVTRENEDALVSEAGDIKYMRSGQGGIYQAFLGAGVTLIKVLNLGIDGQYYFGTINKYSNLVFNSSDAYKTVSSGWRYTPRGLSAKVGLQYEFIFKDQYSFVVGATYQLKTRMHGDAERYAYSFIGSQQDTVKNTVKDLTTMDIPAEMSVGFSVRNAENWLAGFDYTRSDWRSNSFEATPGINAALSLSEKFQTGFELTPDRYDVRYFFKRVTYRFGAYYDKSYLTIGGHQITSEGITLGFSIPVFRYYNAISLGFDFGRRGTLEDNLVKENYFKINLSFNLHDIWFIKSLYQ